MNSSARFWRRAILPASVFVGLLLFHYAWLVVFPEHDPAQSRWATIPGGVSAWGRYWDSQSYWLGYTYALSLAFAATAFRRYRERPSCSAKNAAIGGVTFSGALAVVGCFLLGCCGSPMLAVYIGLFGATFVPFARPLVALLTTVFIVIASYQLARRTKQSAGEDACTCE